MDKVKRESTIDYSYLRRKKAEHLQHLHETFLHKDEKLTASAYQNATVLPLKKFEGDESCFGRGGVVDRNGEYIAQSALQGFVEKEYPFENPVTCDRKVVFCGCFIRQWGHFLLQSVARLWYFLKNDDTVDSYVFFVAEGENTAIGGNYREFLELLGVFDRVEIINTPTTYREVVIPELSFAKQDFYTDEYLTVFDKVVSNIGFDPSWKKYDKVFFTRSYFKKALKTEIGLQIMDDYFERNGYRIVAPEKLSVREMIYLIRNAKDSAFVSGTAPHNMLFAAPGQHCTILERGAHNNDFQTGVNSARALSVTYIDANFYIYIVNASFGPFLLSYHGMLEKYTQDHGLLPPDPRYTSEKYMKKQLASYLDRYKQYYYLQIYMEKWLLGNLDHRYEAYVDTLRYLGKYLNGSVPYRVSQYFTVVHMKKCVDRWLRRIHRVG